MQRQPSSPNTTPPPPPLSSMSFWADACHSANSRSLQTLLDSAYASCGVTVRYAAAACSALLGVQCTWLVTLLLCADCCVLRQRLGERDHVLAVAADGRGGAAAGVYGWFSGLMLCGSCCGAVA